jgi:PAS domain S-box-containing protein
LLARQLRKLGLDPATVPDAAGSAALLARVSAAYAESDSERYLLDRSQSLAAEELRALNDALAASQARLASLLSLSSDWVWEQDAEGRFTHVSADVMQRCGVAPEALLGHAPRSGGLLRLSPDDAMRLQAQRMAGQPFHDVTFEVAGTDGLARHMRISGEPVHADGRCVGWRGVGSEVTATVEAERRTQEQARLRLQAQLDFTARLLEVSPTPFFVKDVQGRFITVNRAWLELMDLQAGQVLGRTSAQVFGAEAPLHMEHDQRLLHSEEQVSYENRLERPGRAPRDTLVIKLRFTQGDGSPAGIIGSIVDVTEFREAERATREAQAATERAMRTKTEFIANISHELRTPLQSIIGFSELGMDREAPHPRWRQLFRNVNASGNRMLKLVNDLLDIAKVGDGATRLNLARHDLLALARDVLAELQPLADARRITLALAGPAEGLTAQVDGFRLQQVMRNLLANALRFAPPDSTVQMRGEALPDGGLRVTVRDHGPGIPEAELEAVFQAFVQSSLTQDGSGGTGLGLTLCRQIMAAHGGRIQAANASGGGALMTLELPAPTPQTLG